MIGVKLVFADFIPKFGSNTTLRHLLTDAWVQLTHLGPLANLVSFLIEVTCGLHSPASCGCPDFQGPNTIACYFFVIVCLFFRFPVSDQTLGHLLGVVLSLLRKRCVGFVRVCIMRNASLVIWSAYVALAWSGKRIAYSCKVGSPRFDVEVQEIEHDAIRKIAKAPVVNDQALASVNHLYQASASHSHIMTRIPTLM